MREPDPYLSPARVGLIMIAVLVFGVIFVRVIAMSEPAEVRTDIRSEGGDRVTQGTGIRGLRGSLP
jgi:hypothetical protein